MFVPTGGFVESSAYGFPERGETIRDSASVPLNREFGTFEALSGSSVSVMFDTTVESRAIATINPTSLSVYGKVDGFRPMSPSFGEIIIGGTVATKITFTLTESASVEFQWFGDSFFGDPISRASLKNAAGDAFLYCYGGYGCFDGVLFDGLNQDLGESGHVELDAGEYEVLLNAHDSIQVGSSGGGVGSLSFHVVPIPAAVWLFGSGIIALFGIRAKSKFSGC